MIGFPITAECCEHNMAIEIKGLEALQDYLEKEIPTQAKNILRTTVHGIAGDIAKGAKANARLANAKVSGNLIKGFKAKRRNSRDNAKSIVVGAPHWHLFEYGTVERVTKSGKSTGRMQETPIVRPEIDRVNANMDAILEAQVRKKLVAAAKRAKKKRLKS